MDNQAEVGIEISTISSSLSVGVGTLGDAVGDGVETGALTSLAPGGARVLRGPPRAILLGNFFLNVFTGDGLALGLRGGKASMNSPQPDSQSWWWPSRQ